MADMFLRWITAAYLGYLVVPIALLLAGSFGELWLNTILPTGLTTRWYRDVAADPSFRRAFTASLAVVALTCAACAAIGLPLAYAVFRTESPRVRALARVLYQMPVALPQSILAGLIIVAALSIGEFQFSNLVAGFLNRTYPVVLLQAFYGATGFACAATVILLALALVAAVAGGLTAGGATRLKTVVA